MTLIRVLVFDGGDTVMRVFPQYSGPMAHWPEVAPVPGIEAALAALAGRYRLAMATNAADSGSVLVRDALRRVGLDRFFEAVFTPRELGARKPDGAFYRSVLHKMRCAAGEAAMIGDDYANDVAGAKASGLAAVWFNPGRAACPEPHPAYDAEVTEMPALPAALAHLHLPDVPACLALLAGQGAPDELVRHVKLVAAVAFRLAERLRVAGEPVDPLLAHRGGLLHDVAKASAQSTGPPHDELGCALLRAHGLADLGRIAERHAAWALTDPRKAPDTWEEKLVCYGDRLAEGDVLLGVSERMERLVRRRPELASGSEQRLAAALALEGEILCVLGTTSDELLAWVRGAVIGC